MNATTTARLARRTALRTLASAALAAAALLLLTACGGGGDGWDEPACPTVTERPEPGQPTPDVGVCPIHE